ncbi:centrosomal protein of 104 kDa [Chanos chanos]|uniref:Centrosomal protein of 104 kDa n=1 Tax=Chanos chanos TaxID=29144 RepID=A0A6J2W6N6_CHACN|nr:centrosomal protein of 104 kDa [Chanos chanos]
MPRKIGFTVISCSSHEDNYSPKELMVHAPTVSGWRSTRFCSYPQEIILQLVERCHIRKLQLLAHQYLIPTKIEFHTGDRLPESSSPGHQDHLRRLGYVSLSDNEKTGYRARELKSVHVDAVGTYLKLTFHKNYINRYNLYNQVALVAINVLADPVDFSDINLIQTRDQLIEQYLNSTQHGSALDGSYVGSKYESISPLDDLAFDMYQDPEVARIIRLLDARKQDMVRQEQYDLAKKLKQAIADLQKVGERLGRYDVEKHSAIEREDYDTAKLKKEQMETYRRRVYEQLEVHNLLDVDQIQRISGMFSENLEVPSPNVQQRQCASLSPETPQKKKKKKKPEVPRMELEQEIPKPQSQQQTQRPVSQAPEDQPKTDVTVLPYDERPLPALRQKDRERNPEEAQPDESLMVSDSVSTACSPGVPGEPEPLTEKAQREASFPIEVYGDSLVAGAYSKTWSYREDALLAVYKKLAEVPSGTPKAELRNMMRAAVFLTKKALSDKVSSVFQASLKLLKMILSQFIPKYHLGRTEVTHCLEQIWPNLISRTGDSSSRLRTLAVTFVQEIALLKEVRPLQMIPGELVKPIKSNMPVRLALSRVELLEALLQQLGAKDSGFTLDNVMRFLTGALEHSASSVRELAVRTVLAMYRLHRNAVLDYLPPNDAQTRKNVLYKNIFDAFSKIDGRPSESQNSKKGGGKQEGMEREKEEIRSLQEQLAALKEISENSKAPERKMEKAAKAGGKKTPQPSPADMDGSPSSGANYLDNLCIFCGEKDESFTEEGLDLHYWKHCPMLRRCVQCRQVVEIASLTEHLLCECERKALFVQCPRCSEAVPKEHMTLHTQSLNCNPPVSGRACNHCPLCHENFVPGEEAWKSHLMGSEGCKQNSRRTAVVQRQQQEQRSQPSQGKTISQAAPKPEPSVFKSRGLGRGSRIPAPASRANKTFRRIPAKR